MMDYELVIKGTISYSYSNIKKIDETIKKIYFNIRETYIF